MEYEDFIPVNGDYKYPQYSRRDTAACPYTLYPPGPKNRIRMAFVWYTPLVQCKRCFKWGSPKQVAYRSECYLAEHSLLVDPILCMGCWNKIKVLIKQFWQTKELQKLSNKLRLAHGKND